MKAILKYPLYRRLSPSNRQDPNGYLDKGEVIEVHEIVTGEMLDGTDTWLKADDGFYYWEGGIIKNELSFSNLNCFSKNFKEYRIEEFWKKGIDGSGINIAIIDDGFMTENHPALNNFRIVNGYKNKNNENALHGTYMATIIGGRNFSSGYFGIAPNANYHLIGLGNITKLSFESFITPLKTSNNIHLASISFNKSAATFGGEARKKQFSNILSNAIVCCSAGNLGQTNEYETYPACYNQSFSVSGFATTNPIILDSNSNFLKRKSGMNVIQDYTSYFNATDNTENLRDFFGLTSSFNGTSSSTAFCVGIIALILCAEAKRNNQATSKYIFENYFNIIDIQKNAESGPIGKAFILNKEKFFNLLND